MVISAVEGLPDNRICNHLGGQLLRSGTSPILNNDEAQLSESKRDFIHKLRITLKELRETSICLKILQQKSLFSNPSILGESNELIGIFAKSIATAKSNG